MMLVKLHTSKEEIETFILMNRFESVSIQLIDIGKEYDLDGTFVFDVILVKGLISNRFIKVTFNNGNLVEDSIEYTTLNADHVAEVNEYILKNVKNITSYFTITEIKKLKKTFI